MRFKLFVIALLFLPMLVTVGWPADHGQIREQIQQKKIVLGQSPRDVRAAIGEPTKITKVQTYWQSTEDWVYGEGKDAFSFTFQEGRLTRITEGKRSIVDWSEEALHKELARMAEKALIFGKDTWPYTTAAREDYGKRKIPFQYINVAKDAAGMKQMLQYSKGGRTVPLIVDGGKVITGFDGGGWEV